MGQTFYYPDRISKARMIVFENNINIKTYKHGDGKNIMYNKFIVNICRVHVSFLIYEEFIFSSE